MKYQRCIRCLMDTTDPDIIFDEQGVCNHCKNAKKLLNQFEMEKAKFDLSKWVQQVKEDGKDKRYDCIVGISGGVDSSYCVYLCKKEGLRPLAVHFDNGWNSEASVQNIKLILEKLEVELYTYVVNWQEFRDLQLAFLKSATPDSEVPTDHMIYPVLGMVAHAYKVKHVIIGKNITSESILPSKWSYGHNDWKYIKDVHKQYGTVKLNTFPHFNRWDWVYFNQKIDWFYILNYIDYDKEDVKKLLVKEFDWHDYGGKHYESFYTKFYQAYILPQKFGYDKRKMHLSSLIVSGQLDREKALIELDLPLYDKEKIEQDIEFFLKKMRISKEEFQSIMNAPPRTYLNYANYQTDVIGKLKKWIIEKVGNK